jgi:hypothetical protein
MSLPRVLTIAAWNALLGRINALASAPPSGCTAKAVLPFVSAPHRWSQSDVMLARNKLSEICSTNVFNAPIDKWRVGVTDEFEAAIAHGWCGCVSEPCCITAGMVSAFEQYLYGNIDYATAAATIGSTRMARLVLCVNDSKHIGYTQYHQHLTQVVSRLYWRDTGVPRSDEGVTTNSSTSETLGSGYVASFAPSYHSSTSVGPRSDYDSRVLVMSYWDFDQSRYYDEYAIATFDVDNYWYTFSVPAPFLCP